MLRIVRNHRAAFLLILCVVALISCASQPSPNVYDPPGFFMGIVHGFCILFSLVGSFLMYIRIYAFPNSGGFYDLGYFIGLMFLGGVLRGASAS